MAEAVVSFLLQSISKLLAEEGKFLSGVSDEAQKLRLGLETMRAFLKDADEKQHKRDTVRELVSQCKDLAYEAEAILEDYAFKLASRRHTGRLCFQDCIEGIFSIIKRYACIHIQHNVGKEIQSLNTRISDLTNRFRDYGIVEATEGEGPSSRQQQQRRMTYSYVATDEDFVGFGDDVEKLVPALVNDNTHGVVSICGMGGSGKTTLARKVYNHPHVRQRFECFAWVCISQQWQTRNLLQGILVSFLPDKRNEIEKWRADEIVEQLVRVMNEKKCLVVLDDIWSIDAWEDIKSGFPMRKKGNKLLLTTRNKDVAVHIGPNGYHHEPRLLTDAESLELLMKKAMRDLPHQEDNENLRVLGKEMVKSCSGLPLAVVVLGGILATKQGSTEWEGVHKNIKSYLGKGERMDQNQGEVPRILSLSYSDLPYKLKPCFLYLSLFPEDKLIEAKSLYGLWIAEGMVLEEDRMGDESMIEMADRYLGELAKRCLVTVVKSWVYTHERYDGCRLHDLLRDLCKAKAREEKFLEFIDYGGGNHIELSNPRIMISLGEKEAARHSPIQLQQGSKHLRTLVVSGQERTDLMMGQILSKLEMKMFKMLRSLVLENVETQEAQNVELPVGKLIHLRLLRLTESVLMMSPSSISKLEHLEIFDLRDSVIRWTKNVPIKMRRLRYLDLQRAKSNFVMEIYVVDPNHLEVIYGLPSSSYYVRTLSELTNVRALGCLEFEKEMKGLEEIVKSISKSQHLKNAQIRTYFDAALVAQLFGSNTVENMWLIGSLGKLPEYDSHFLINLLSLRLDGSGIEEDPMKILEKLPKLQRLEIVFGAFYGEEMVCHSWGFPQLTFLLFIGLSNLETWTLEKDAMPNLSHLQIYSCSDQLQIIPEDEVGFVTALEKLELEDMSEEFLERNINKFRHVPSIVVDGSQYVP